MTGGFEPNAIAEVLCDVFGAGARWKLSETTVQRHDYQVVIASRIGSTEKVVVKLAGAEAPHYASADSFERLENVSRLLEQRGVAVPRMLAVDTSCRRSPFRYMVTSFWPGITWHVARPAFSSTDLSRLMGELGEVVARVHAISFEAFGDLDSIGGVRDGNTYGRALAARAACRIADPRLSRIFERLIHEHAEALSRVVRPALTHEDLHHFNLLVSQHNSSWHLAGLLDLDSAWAGNTESDLAKLSLWRGMQHPAFWAAYTSQHALSADFESRRALLQLLWCLEYARPTREHHAVTAGVCAELGIAPIRFDT